MQRELNPNLFGRPSTVERAGDRSAERGVDAFGAGTIHGGAHSGPHSGMTSSQRPVRSESYLPNDVKELELQVQTLKTQMQAMERKIETLNHQLVDAINAYTGRFDRQSQGLAKLEQMQTEGIHELSNRVANLVGKMNERRIQDLKVTEMLDRHNIIVQNFENRLTHMTRVLNDQERHILHSSALLEEARTEISRLKRG